MEFIKASLIILIIVVVLFFAYRQQFSTKTPTTQAVDVAKLLSFVINGSCSFKNSTGYSLCCMTDKSATDCTKTQNLICGQEVGFLETIKLDQKYGYYCFDEDALPNKPPASLTTGTISHDGKVFGCGDYSNSSGNVNFASVYFTPVNRTQVTFSEVYAFPKGVTYSTLGEFLANLGQADKILSAKVGVTCS